eukprot:m.257327 g.257327  ORF g.257327 m.257327 type:complete len:255 (-) comp24567_c0_seq1:187-951(-)
MSDLPVFSTKSLSSPGIKLASFAEGFVSLRVYAANAILSPGAEYKSILASEETTAAEVIKLVLERYGDPSDPNDFELRSVLIDDKTGKVKRQRSFANLFGGASEPTITLDSDLCPVLFADWYADESRRFELHRKESVANPRSLSRQGSSFLKSFRRKTRTSLPNFSPHREILNSSRTSGSAVTLPQDSHADMSSISVNNELDDDASSVITEVGEQRFDSPRSQTSSRVPVSAAVSVPVLTRSPRKHHARYESTV